MTTDSSPHAPRLDLSLELSSNIQILVDVVTGLSHKHHKLAAQTRLLTSLTPHPATILVTLTKSWALPSSSPCLIPASNLSANSTVPPADPSRNQASPASLPSAGLSTAPRLAPPVSPWCACSKQPWLPRHHGVLGAPAPERTARLARPLRGRLPARCWERRHRTTTWQ